MAQQQTKAARPARASGAVRVLVGILLSRIVGLLRDRALAHYFGLSAHGDVFRTALRAPNVLQNLLGEGSISAAFIPIYSRLLEDGREQDAGRFAGAIFGLLLAVAAVLSLVGVLLAAPLVTVFASGFLTDAGRIAAGEPIVDRFALTVAAVRIVFPMTGVLVLSAWALGVLNSHRRFFLAYFAPVLWNVAIIVGLFLAAGSTLATNDPTGFGRLDRLLTYACYGALVGGVLQFAVQLPLVGRLLQGFRLSLSRRVEGVGEALRAFGPVVAGRGVYQLSAYLDLWLASWLASGAIIALANAQALYILPVSLFGMSVAAAELPELSRRDAGIGPEFSQRLHGSLRQMAFLTVPTTVGYLAFGFLVVGALYRTGSFGVRDNWLVYVILGGYTLGLLATTTSRLLQNAFYALRDTRTPARIAAARVTVAAIVAIPLMLSLDRIELTGSMTAVDIGTDGAGPALRLGAAGLALGSAVGAWVEVIALVRVLSRRIAGFGLPLAATGRMAAMAALSTVPAAAAWWVLPGGLHVIVVGGAVLGLYAACYLGIARATGMPELARWTGRLRRSS